MTPRGFCSKVAITLGAFLLLVCTVWPLAAQARTESDGIFNLRSYGWEIPQRRETNRPSIAIDRNGRVVVGFTVGERKGLVTRSHPSLSFRVLRFQPDGKTDLSLSLPTNVSGRTGIYLSQDDRIIVRANDSLQLLTTDERTPEGVAWKILAPCSRRCHVEQSASRQTLFLFSEDADPPLTIIRFSEQPVAKQCGKARKTIDSNDSIQNYPQSITDEFAYFFGEMEYRWPFCDYEHRFKMNLQLQGRVSAMSDNRFVVNTSSLRPAISDVDLKVVSLDGSVKFKVSLPKHESADSLWVPIRSSEQADTIAVDIFTMRGGNRALDLSGHLTARRIAVYDVIAGRELASIAVKPKHDYSFEFDLSPDGRRLAILEDDTARVVNLVSRSPLPEQR